MADEVRKFELAKAKRTNDDVLLTQPQVQHYGWQMCDRDIKLVTCTVDEATAVRDMKINPTTLKEESWDEASLVGVYKDDAGTMVQVADQTDADTNGILSVFEYQALDQQADPKSPIAYDIRDGGLIVADDIPAGEEFDHRAYAVAAPDLGPNYYVRLFDGYLGIQPDRRVEAKSPQAKALDISQTSDAGVIRVYIVHPAGAKHSHTLRLVTYRPTGTF